MVLVKWGMEIFWIVALVKFGLAKELMLKFCIYLYDIHGFELLSFAYLLDCIPIGIQLLYKDYQLENESRPHCLKRYDWEELNHHNTFLLWVMYLNPHHKWSRNQSWKNRFFCCAHLTVTINWSLPADRIIFYIKI